MKNNKTVLIVVLIFVLVMAGSWILYQNLGKNFQSEQLAGQDTTQQQEENAGSSGEEEELSIAPEFTVYDIDGNEVHLTDYFGKPIVMNFWASWCGPCRSEMDHFNAKAAELEGEVQFLMINMTDGSRETVEKASEFIEKNGYTFPVFYDTESNAAMTYGASALPTTFFLDAEGHAVAQARGAIDAPTLQRGIDMILE